MQFEKILYGADDKVRMEAPEIFRVLGKSRPEFVMLFMEQLLQISETDDNRVVRIHCLGAIKVTVSKSANLSLLILLHVHISLHQRFENPRRMKMKDADTRKQNALVW